MSEVAEATGLSSNAVYRAIAAGELRASKLRRRLRVQRVDLEAWIDSNVVSTPGAQEPVPAHSLVPGRVGHGLRELLEADASAAGPSGRLHACDLSLGEEVMQE